ncbi:MAG: AraC family transcriptional regulator [Lentilactobacillus hilgardii]|uniref:AraC family transcriptional regulator n=1 Tax=Lentilactobacillus hilgardii TaxID=1588 RepID=UPI001CC1D7AF|nr:AraC family transcriptional regulator [Lentilactobacillus hilgardii]MBZ2200780.1 AraC family transcriptional regulator [Lentilactobacillus hilgardii]MBZ2203779.1 AraC family transcriptional regulator [Lentilactobacillus hilgardii]MCT3400144.1 AraC family transcriptional regulator [Lentilactobacillus hilgardii]MCV3741751.1 AraC family transcriptional regulator [Lentilactobacillus hilgardii]
MLSVTCFDISAPVLHISSGKFTAAKNWMHKHMYHDGNFEIIIVIKGTLYMQVDNDHYQLNSGDVFALPPYHHLHGYKPSPEDTQYFWFHFFMKPNGLKTIDVEQDSGKITALFNSDTAVLPLIFNLSTVEKEFVLANQILDVSASNYFTSLSVDYLLTEMIIQLSEDYYQKIIGPSPSEHAARVETIKNWIRANLSESLRVGDVADAFALNPHYLVRIFKEQSNETVIQYINKLKMEEAKELLVRTNMAIKQIAGMAFFSDEKRFMKAFKKYTNLTPSEFRRAYTQQFLDSSNFDPEVPITKNTEDYRRRFE